MAVGYADHRPRPVEDCQAAERCLEVSGGLTCLAIRLLSAGWLYMHDTGAPRERSGLLGVRVGPDEATQKSPRTCMLENFRRPVLSDRPIASPVQRYQVLAGLIAGLSCGALLSCVHPTHNKQANTSTGMPIGHSLQVVSATWRTRIAHDLHWVTLRHNYTKRDR